MKKEWDAATEEQKRIAGGSRFTNWDPTRVSTGAMHLIEGKRKYRGFRPEEFVSLPKELFDGAEYWQCKLNMKNLLDVVTKERYQGVLLRVSCYPAGVPTNPDPGRGP